MEGKTYPLISIISIKFQEFLGNSVNLYTKHCIRYIEGVEIY